MSSREWGRKVKVWWLAGFACGAIPDKGGFALVCDAHRNNFDIAYFGLGCLYSLLQTHQHALPDLQGVMFYPPAST